MLKPDQESAMVLFEQAQIFVNEITEYLKSWIEDN
jgi:hypothetical protein